MIIEAVKRCDIEAPLRGQYVNTNLGPPTPERAPLVASDLPGTGGALKLRPGAFILEELPLYAASGEGPHVYLTLRREGMTTRQLEEGLARMFALRELEVGCAGLKDKMARVTQTFSLYLPRLAPEDVARRVAMELPVEVLSVSRHGNRLRRGHLLGNRFDVLVEGVDEGALARAEAVRAAILDRGLPNFYGTQRFGGDGTNALKGREALLGRGPRQLWLRRFLLSAWQSALFNAWLVGRIQRGAFAAVIAGDVAKKTDTGGLFDVTDATADEARLRRGEITYTGPIYGHGMRWAEREPGEWERELLAADGVDAAALRRARLNGSRRPGRIAPGELTIEPSAGALRFRFTLPKGAYATILLREFVRDGASLPDGDDGGAD